MFTLEEIGNHLTGMLHGGTLNKVRNRFQAYKRAGQTMLSKIDPVTTIRTQPITSVIYSDVYNYALAEDFKKIIDLIPQDSRTSMDQASRVFARPFDLRKAIEDKQISIESEGGTKFLRVNWKFRGPRTLNAMDSLTANGTWSVVATATGLVLDEIYKRTGGGAIRFDVVASGDGIQNSTMRALNLTTEDEIADLFVDIYFPSVSSLTSISTRWGNNLTTTYWTGVAQTAQADGTAFKAGWNTIKVPWSTATETGTVDPTAIDSFRLTVASSGAIADIRVDNVRFVIGRPFDIKYYGSYPFKNSAGTYIATPTADTDFVVIDDNELPIFLHECLIAMAHQIEGEDSGFDIEFAKGELKTLYKQYKFENPTESMKKIGSYSGGPRFQR